MCGSAVAHGMRSAAYPSERLAVEAGRFARGSLRKVTASPNIPLWRDPNGHAHMLIGEQNEHLFVRSSRVPSVVFAGACGGFRAVWLCLRTLAPGLPRGRVWPLSCRTSRSFVLASLRALHLDLRLRQRQGGSDRGMAGSAPGTGRARRWVADRGRSVVTGSGSGLSEEPVSGV